MNNNCFSVTYEGMEESMIFMICLGMIETVVTIRNTFFRYYHTSVETAILCCNLLFFVHTDNCGLNNNVFETGVGESP